MPRRRKSSPIEDWFELVSMMPWWAGVALAAISYLFLHAIAEPGTAADGTQPARLGEQMGHMLWQMLASVGQYIAPMVCLAGAAASAIGRSKTREDGESAPLATAPRTSGRRRRSCSDEKASIPFAMFLGGAALLVVPRVTDAELVHAVFGPLRFLGYTLLLVGFVLSLLVIWSLFKEDRPRLVGNETASIGTVERTPWKHDDNWDPERDRIAAEYRSFLDRAAQPRAPASLQSVMDVERMLDVIEWRRFEALVERVYQLTGFSTSTQAHGADGGVDIKLFLEDNPDELAGVVQCKHWGRRYVGVELLRALRGSMAAFGASQGYFVTSSTFTPDAIEFAAGNQIKVVERDRLVAMIMGFTPDQRETVLKVALDGRYDVPTCASCGTKMVKRQPRRGGREFWGCVNYPGCRSVIRIGRKA